MAEPAVHRAPEAGMIALKADLSDARVAAALDGVPAPLRAGFRQDRTSLWMAPDELLKVCARERVARIMAELEGRLADIPHLLADVSDMRAGFDLAGPGWREVLAKLTPADMAPRAFRNGHVRRTRLGQVAAAIWTEHGGSARILVARSVADYAEALLTHAARPEARLRHF